MKPALSILALLSVHAVAMENAVPGAFPPDRYARIAEKSPFALATPVAAPPPPPQASFAANWYLTAVGRDAQGEDFVTIKAQDGSVHFSLSGKEANPTTGVALASVDWSDTLRKSTAIIKKGTETAKLVFSQEEATPTQVQAARGRLGAPGGIQMPQAPMPVTGGLTLPTIPQPRIALPKPGGPPQPVVAPQPVNGASPGNGTQLENRRRIRTITPPQP